MLFYQISAYTIHEKKSYKKNEFKILGSYSISDIQIILNTYQKTWGKTVNPSIRIYVNKIENRISFKIDTGYYFKLLTPETMELLGSDKSKTKMVKMLLT